MGGATLSLPRLPLGSLCSPIFFAHAVFSLLFPPMRSLVPGYFERILEFCIVLFRLQFSLSHTSAVRGHSYEELTLAEFVAEYAQVLLCKDISPLERTEREKHLVSLMYFAQQ